MGVADPLLDAAERLFVGTSIVNVSALVELRRRGRLSDSATPGCRSLSASGASSQNRTFAASDSGYGYLTNVNGGKLLEIYQNSTANGAVADQWGATGFNCRQWWLTKQGIQ